MTTTTVYVVGRPGVGKSTLVAAITEPWSELTLEKRPVRHTLWQTPADTLVAELGARRDTFSGTDALAMDAIRHVEPWVGDCGYDLVLGEGDRLANNRFFIAAQAAGRLVLVHCDTDQADARRAERGSDQDASWLAGRATKVANLVDAWADRADQYVALDTTPAVVVVAAQLRDAVPELRGT